VTTMATTPILRLIGLGVGKKDEVGTNESA
jgi:hypothetical protein